MITMPEFSEQSTELESKILCHKAAEVFKQFRKSVGYSESEVPKLAFVNFAEDRFGEYQDGVFYDNLGIYIIRFDVKDFSRVFSKKPENEWGIRPDFPLSEAEKGRLWGEYQAYLPIQNEAAIKREESQFISDFYHLS